MDRKEGVAQLFCKVCDQRYQSKVNRVSYHVSSTCIDLLTTPYRADLTEPIDIYSEWIDAADAAERAAGAPRPVATSSRAANAPVNYGSDDE